MTATAGSPSVTVPSPERLAVLRTGPDRGTVPPAIVRSRPGREFVRTAVSVAIVAAIFGFALPRFASYGSVLSSMSAMTWPQALLVGAAAAASMASGWIVICSVLPSIRLREAAVVNLGSNAVANTLPAGGALAMGVSWAMLSSWGVSTADNVLYTMVSGIWNVFARLGLPVLALLILVTASRPGVGLIAAAGVSLTLLTAAAAGLGLLLRSESFALRAGRALQRMIAVACRLARRPLPPDVAGWLPDFRGRAVLLYRAVTYLPPIPLGAIACLTWRHAPALIRSSPRNAGRQRGPAMQRDTADVIVAIDTGSASGTEKVMDLSASP